MNTVIKLKKDSSIAYVSLEEKEYRNTFTKRFIEGLKEVFLVIDKDAEIRTVIVHGFDPYFCCGGTKEELISLCRGSQLEGEGKARFTDLSLHDILLECKVPVIAAMQGHALGGGLAFGCFADIMIMAEECIYSANFMKYGFTPGMGSTYIIPKKMGNVLGNEMLITANNYFGRELKERGASPKIVRKQDVITCATEIARTIADKPMLSLQELKRNLNLEIKRELPKVIERELLMHQITFSQPDVMDRIEMLFGN